MPWRLRGKGFTLIELVVAVGLLVMVVVFAGTIFKVSIGSQRAATANAEIMQKFRALTAQLDFDFSGLQKDAPLLIWFQLDPCDPNYRFDQVMFFADGDFQSTQPYYVASSGFLEPAPTGVPVIGNLARIYYGQARLFSPSLNRLVLPQEQQSHAQKDKTLNIRQRTLSRRQHILTADPDIVAWPLQTGFPASFAYTVGSPPNPLNNIFEHDRLALAEWKVIAQTSANTNQIIATCFAPAYRPQINLTTAAGYHLLMTQGLAGFSVQFGYRYTTAVPVPVDEYLWYPDIDPDGKPLTLDSDFATMGLSAFGVYFNIAPPSLPAPPGIWFAPAALASTWPSSAPVLFPQALKFTFTLYDSKGIYPEGQTFTHIVYLED